MSELNDQWVLARTPPEGWPTEGDFLFNTKGWQRFGLTGDGIDPFGYMCPLKLDPSFAER